MVNIKGVQKPDTIKKPNSKTGTQVSRQPPRYQPSAAGTPITTLQGSHR